MTVILNRAAGTPAEKSEESDAKIAELFAAEGAQIRIVLPDDQTDRSALAQAAADETLKPSLLVAIDGEVTRPETPLRYRIRSGAVRVLVPQNDRP